MAEIRFTSICSLVAFSILEPVVVQLLPVIIAKPRYRQTWHVTICTQWNTVRASTSKTQYSDGISIALISWIVWHHLGRHKMPPKKLSANSNSPNKPPKNWPSHLVYLTSPSYSRLLPPDILARLNPHKAKLHIPPHSALAIKRITQEGHPAKGQLGLFATARIPRGTYLVDYLGYVSIAPETSTSSDYVLSLCAELGVGIDAERMGNEARFVNDYRGVRNRPNAGFVDVERNGERRIGIETREEVKKGEELCVSYGKGFWEKRAEEARAAEAEEGGHK